MIPSENPTLTVIIVSYNTRDLLAGCLNSLRRVEDEADFEVIVVDNASADGSPAMVRENFPEVRLIEAGRNTGFAAANNLGLAQAKGKFLFFLNPDTIVPRGTLVQMLAPLSPGPFPHDVGKGEQRVAVVGASLMNPDGTWHASTFEFPNLWREFWNFLPEMKSGVLWTATKLSKLVPFRKERPPKTRRVECVSGAAMMVRTDVMRDIGGFDEGFFLYHEERDLCCRLAAKGWEIWTMPGAPIIHYDAQASGYKTNRFPCSPILDYRVLGMDRLYQKHRPQRHRAWRMLARRMLRFRGQDAREVARKLAEGN
jgi:hypothetical protein